MLRFLTAGESHGPGLTTIVEGFPAGLPVAEKDVNTQLRRRQKGFGSGGRMKIERDRVSFMGGVMDGHTTGAPIAMQIENQDWANWREGVLCLVGATPKELSIQVNPPSQDRSAQFPECTPERLGTRSNE